MSMNIIVNGITLTPEQVEKAAKELASKITNQLFWRPKSGNHWELWKIASGKVRWSTDYGVTWKGSLYSPADVLAGVDDMTPYTRPDTIPAPKAPAPKVIKPKVGQVYRHKGTTDANPFMRVMGIDRSLYRYDGDGNWSSRDNGQTKFYECGKDAMLMKEVAEGVRVPYVAPKVKAPKAIPIVGVTYRYKNTTDTNPFASVDGCSRLLFRYTGYGSWVSKTGFNDKEVNASRLDDSLTKEVAQGTRIPYVAPKVEMISNKTHAGKRAGYTPFGVGGAVKFDVTIVSEDAAKVYRAGAAALSRYITPASHAVLYLKDSGEIGWCPANLLVLR